MNLLKRNSSPTQRHTNTSSASNQIGFTPGSPQNVPQAAPAATTQSQISPQQPHHSTGTTQNHQSSATTQQIVSSATASIPLLMGGEHSAFRALNPLNPSTAALLAASAQLGLARSYLAASEHHHHLNNNNNNNSSNNNNVASSTSTNQSPPISPHPSESDEEINVHDDESDTELTNNSSKNHSHIGYSNSKTPLELTKHDRN